MAVYRLMPPANGTANPFTFQGRTYSCAVGSTIDVHDDTGTPFDETALASNGWTPTSSLGVGPTGARPTSIAKPRDTFVDTTLGLLIIYDGAAWRLPTTGAAV